MEDVLERELHRAVREKKGIGFIMGDIDHFKDFNDKYGHEAGDLMLKAVAATIKKSVRAEDIACRFGGEEFLVILPSASIIDTHERARQVHDEVSKIRFDYGGSHISNASISMGISAFPNHGSNSATLISMADMAMYNAKRQGRGRVCLPV
jgi:diguanylate cyclase (GGDEF)-like protein